MYRGGEEGGGAFFFIRKERGIKCVAARPARRGDLGFVGLFFVLISPRSASKIARSPQRRLRRPLRGLARSWGPGAGAAQGDPSSPPPTRASCAVPCAPFPAGPWDPLAAGFSAPWGHFGAGPARQQPPLFGGRPERLETQEVGRETPPAQPPGEGDGGLPGSQFVAADLRPGPLPSRGDKAGREAAGPL